jgi:murein DD-endopeptidase MepM/ murein hydrolase activator NlpD
MANRYYTLMLVPEKTSSVKSFVIPLWVLRVGALLLPLLGLLLFVMSLDYWYVLDQVNETRDLRAENRRLRQQVQVYKNRMTSIEATLDRVQSFATRLKVITNLEDKDQLTEHLDKTPPKADENTTWHPPQPSEPQALLEENDTTPPAHMSPEEWIELKERRELEKNFRQVSFNSLDIERGLHELYELLSDQRAFLGALPIRRPASGMMTSFFGIRESPFGEGEKMHEGIDIANNVGTPIVAPANGLVVLAGRKSGYGLTLILDHDYGLETLYGHTSQIYVKTGDRVRRGQKIAALGNSGGRSTGPHLHYEVHVHGVPIDPLNYLIEN